MQWAQNLCRTCGQISEACHSILNNAPNVLDDKIVKCLKLNLCKEDYKPKQICNSCVVKLNEFSDFMDTCYATNEKFETIYLNSLDWPNKTYNNYLPLQKQSVIVSNKQVPDNLDLELCNNINNCQINEKDVLELVAESSYNPENCSEFLSDTKTKSPFTTVLRHHSTAVVSHPQNFNGHIGTNKISYIKYSTSSTQNNANCQSSKLKGNAEDLVKRIVTVDAIQKSLEQHVINKIHHKEKPKKTHSCPHCQRVFSRRGTLNSHIANHTNVRPYKCEECLKCFAVKSDLTGHKKIHGDKHKCVYCSKKFGVASKLERHIRTHTNNKPFVCNFANCRKAFSDKCNLEGHKLVHTSEKKFSCSVCKKLFKTSSRLKQHAKCHLLGIMYTCDLCSKKYKYKNNLISHIKKHNNVCPYCRMNCESNTVLNYHIRVCRARL